MATLRLSFLGSPEVHLAGEMLTFRTRKALALLIYLVVERGTHPREKLTALLWPESDVRRGQMSLRRALASLRKSLGDTVSSPRKFILVKGDTLGFDFGASFDLDIETLKTASKLAHAAEGVEPSLNQEYLDPLQAAVETYRGDFLEGFTLRDTHLFDEWAGIQREFYHRQIDLIFSRLSQIQSETGQMASALETSLRWVRHDNLSEAAYRRLMRVHYAMGQRTAALEVYESCKRILEEELDLEPVPETQDLAERIRAGAAPVSLLQDGRSPTPDPQAVLEKPFVGRAAEHGVLVARYHKARRTRAQVVVLIGEAGIGKTRLASEFLSWAAAQGAQVLVGRAFETGGNLPYQPWAEILRRGIVREAFDQDLLSDIWLGELSRLLPELLDRYPGLSPLKVDESAAQARLFESVTKLGEALAERAPVVIFMDDFQWADTASLDLLHYAGRSWADTGIPVFLLLSARSEALATTPALVEWLARLDRDLVTTRLNLDPLSCEHTQQWVQYLAGEGADQETVDEFSAWLHDETGGQPFYIAAMLEALLERRVLTRRPGGGGMIEFQAATRDMEFLRGYIPPGVREVILARLAQLTPDAFSMLSAGAVLGHRFDFELLRHVADFPEGNALVALDQLLNHHLFTEETAGETQLQHSPLIFTHDKIRDVAYTEAGVARRRIFHRRALEALERVSAPAAELAQHALAAGRVKAAILYNIAAGDEAVKLAATQEAITNYTLAYELVERENHDPIESEHLVHLYINFGRALELSGRFTEALLRYEELDAMGHQRSDRSMELAALLARVALHATPNPVADPIQAQALSERALALSRDLDDQEAEAKLLWGLSHVYRLTGRMPQSIDFGERSLALARSLDLREQIAFTLNDLGSHAYFMSGHTDKARASLREASDLWRELGNLPMLVDSLASMALVCSFAGEYDQVLLLSEEAYQISLSTANLWGQAFSRMQVGNALWEQGKPGQAIAAMEESIRVSEIAGFGVPQVLTRATLAEIFGSLGAIERGLEVAHLALAAAEISIPHSHRFVLAVMAHLHLLDGNLSEAETCLRQAKGGPDPDIFPIFSSRVQLADCELAYTRGHFKQALMVSDGLLENLIRCGLQATIPVARCLKGQILLRLNQAEAARECLLKGRAAAETIGSRRALWPILLTLSQLERDPTRALILRQQAREIVEFIRDHISAPDLRSSYLQLAQVREVLDT